MQINQSTRSHVLKSTAPSFWRFRFLRRLLDPGNKGKTILRNVRSTARPWVSEDWRIQQHLCESKMVTTSVFAIETLLKMYVGVPYCFRKQDRSYMYNVRLRSFRVTIVMEKENVFNHLSVCTYSCLSYPAFIAHTPYCHLWPASFYSIFPYFLIRGWSQKKCTRW